MFVTVTLLGSLSQDLWLKGGGLMDPVREYGARDIGYSNCN
jgi:hypothetical protein